MKKLCIAVLVAGVLLLLVGCSSPTAAVGTSGAALSNDTADASASSSGFAYGRGFDTWEEALSYHVDGMASNDWAKMMETYPEQFVAEAAESSGMSDQEFLAFIAENYESIVQENPDREGLVCAASLIDSWEIEYVGELDATDLDPAFMNLTEKPDAGYRILVDWVYKDGYKDGYYHYAVSYAGKWYAYITS